MGHELKRDSQHSYHVQFAGNEKSSMIAHSGINDQSVRNKIRQQVITLAGNSRLKIYGKLSCASGKRMRKENRIFFSSEREAIANGYRPYGHCLRKKYKYWKNESIQ